MVSKNVKAEQKILVIAEKPSVANDLAKALGGKFTKINPIWKMKVQ